MLSKFKVAEHKKLADNKGYIITFQSPFGDRIGAYVNNDDTDFLNKYYVESIHVLDLYAYKDKEGQARLGIKLERDVIDEAF